MDNSNKTILDLCGGTGAWSKPYRDAGYDVRVITLPEYDVRKVDFDTHAIVFKRQDTRYDDTMTVLYSDVYGILAAPPCTEFSLAKGGRPRDFKGALEIVSACQKIIWQCRIFGNLKFWALENPVGFLRQFLGIPHYTFEQWQYGERRIKPTDIWGYFKTPTPIVKVKPDLSDLYPKWLSHSRVWGSRQCPDEYKQYLSRFKSDERRAAMRAITPAGFAKAFHRANK